MEHPPLAETALHLLAAKYIQIAGFTMMLFDHMLTFSVEVEKIWKRPMSIGSALFLINRYGTPLQYVAIINAFHDPRWTKEICDRHSVFEGASSVAMIGICELVMILRVYALYGRSLWVLLFLLSIWATQLIMSAIGLSTGYAIPLPPGLVGCIYTGTNPLFPCLWVTPLVTDSIIFIMTIWRGRQYLKFTRFPINHIFVRDGTVFYFVIFLSNLANTLIFFATKTADLKPIAASFNQLLTSTMISRLVLNLRNVGYQDEATNIRPISQDIRFTGGGSGMRTGDVAWTYDDDPRQGRAFMLKERESKRYTSSFGKRTQSDV